MNSSKGGSRRARPTSGRRPAADGRPARGEPVLFEGRPVRDPHRVPRVGLDEPVEWIFARDLLSNGIRGPRGPRRRRRLALVHLRGRRRPRRRAQHRAFLSLRPGPLRGADQGDRRLPQADSLSDSSPAARRPTSSTSRRRSPTCSVRRSSRAAGRASTPRRAPGPPPFLFLPPPPQASRPGPRNGPGYSLPPSLPPLASPRQRRATGAAAPGTPRDAGGFRVARG